MIFNAPVNRDLYLADGRHWFEPDYADRVETKEEVEPTTVLQICAVCDVDLVPQVLRCTFERHRTWTRTGGISGKFSPWGDWCMIQVECLHHATEKQPNELVPF